MLLNLPAAGMDAVARQGLRTLLRSARANCAMLLTTHFMDEADLLADEVAIVASGRLVAHGPSLSLKVDLSASSDLPCPALCAFWIHDRQAATRAQVADYHAKGFLVVERQGVCDLARVSASHERYSMSVRC